MTSEFYPSATAIPDAARIPDFLEQREYLITGELRRWEGEMNPVVSPIWVREGANVAQKVIGSTPLLTSRESLQALDAAVAV